MRMSSRALVSAVSIGFALALAFGSTDSPLRAQTAADLFHRDVLHDLRLTMHPRDLATLRATFELNTWYPVTVQWGAMRVRDAAARSRGLGSRNPVKLGLELDFDRYVKGRRVLGLSSLVLDNLWQDKSLMREPLALEMFERAGIAASRASFARVFINNEYQGLYSLVEPIDVEFLGRAFQDTGAFLFEYKWLFDYRAQDLGDDLTVYAPLLEARSHEAEPAEALWGPFRELFRAANDVDAPSWRADVDTWLNLDQLVRYLAVEAYLAENDGFLGYAGMNNHYWYRPSGSTQHALIPWDKDFAFTFLDSSIFREVDTNVLVRRALDEPDLRAVFLDTIEQCANLAEEDNWFAGEIERIVELIGAAVESDTRKQFSMDDFLTDVEFLRTFAAVRPQIVREEVARSR